MGYLPESPKSKRFRSNTSQQVAHSPGGKSGRGSWASGWLGRAAPAEWLLGTAALCTWTGHSPTCLREAGGVGGIWLPSSPCRKRKMPSQGGTWPSQVSSNGLRHPSWHPALHVRGRPLGLPGCLPPRQHSGTWGQAARVSRPLPSLAWFCYRAEGLTICLSSEIRMVWEPIKAP